jgi:hypothetical protein
VPSQVHTADGSIDWVRERMKPLLAALHASLTERMDMQPKVFGWDTLLIGSCLAITLRPHGMVGTAGGWL